MKHCFLLLFALLCSGILRANTPIPQNLYTVQTFSSDNTNHPVADAFDGDTTTWWALYNSAGYSLPGFVEIDLGAQYDVAGISYVPNPSSSTVKAKDYEVYLSNDGITWGTAETIGQFQWSGDSDISRKFVNFGAVTAQYVKVVYLSTYLAGAKNIHTGDLVVYESSTPATGQQNQAITFSAIPEQYVGNPSISLYATASSGLAISYSVVSGPATINGSTLSLTGQAGTVVVQADQAGDTSYYPVSITHQFDVVDLSNIKPILTTRLSEAYPIYMDSLVAYPIYLTADIAYSNQLSISAVSVEENGQVFSAEYHDNAYRVLWTPSSFGSHTISLKATGSNGVDSIITRTVTVSNTASNLNFSTIDSVDIIFGGQNSRTYTGTYSFPQHLDVYNKLNAFLRIECPSAGCDPYDRRAHIDVKDPHGNWVQIMRYMTPFGIGCNHSIDLTDYAHLLQGDVELRVFIDTWSKGWKVSLDFSLQTGTPIGTYCHVQELWDGKYNFGNTNNLQPLDTVDYKIPAGVNYGLLSISTTGHGWGSNNSQNAAEFYNATNYLHINSTQAYTHNFWKTCNPNPDGCTGQLGTWTYNRAGWCPGAIAKPTRWSFTSYINTGSPLNMVYQFDPTYQDYCHASNPSCVSGVTCADCNDNYNPSFDVDAHLVLYSSTPLPFTPQVITETKRIDEKVNIAFELFPNPTNNFFRMQCENISEETVLSIKGVNGQTYRTYYFNSAAAMNQQLFDVSMLASGVYFVVLENQSGSSYQKLIVE